MTPVAGPTVLRLRGTRLRAADARRAAAALRRGGVIAFPTDTVYGLGTSAADPGGRRRLHRLKGRESSKPLPVLVESLSRAERLAAFDRRARALARAFWPGPLTLVLTASPAGRPAAGGARSLGLRVPDHPGLRALLRACGPLASSSANRSGRRECRSAAAVLREFGGGLACVLDGGAVRGRPSTVVDLTGRAARILREGRLPSSRIAAVLRPLTLPAPKGRGQGAA